VLGLVEGTEEKGIADLCTSPSKVSPETVHNTSAPAPNELAMATHVQTSPLLAVTLTTSGVELLPKRTWK
jgi:hypothetical protein